MVIEGAREGAEILLEAESSAVVRSQRNLR